MAKMIKVTYTRPSTDVEWIAPLTAYSGWDDIPEDIRASNTVYRESCRYDTAPDDALFKVQTITNSPNELSMEIYMWFPNYETDAPSNLEAYVMNAMRAYDIRIADTTTTGTSPISGETITLSYNKGNKWGREYRARNGILITNYEEVDHEFPST